MILVDTSIWVNLLGPKPSYVVSAEQLFAFATCPPVIQELMQGLPTDQRFAKLKESILSLPCISPTVATETYIHAAEIYRAGRKRGLTIRSSIDCLIAAIAIEHDISVWHKDRDFAAIAGYTDLKCADV